MKTLYFVRHAKSSWDNNSLDDIDRPLAKRGLRDAPFMAQLIKGKGDQVEQIISSPANRALTTATFFAEALDINKEDIVVDPQIYESWPEDIIELVRSLPKNISTAMIFGHNPTFTGIANMFSSEYITNVPTCGVFKLLSSATEWKLLTDENTSLTDFYFPKQYFD